MRGFWTILKKELQLYFATPLAYIVIGLLLVVSGLVYYQIINYYSRFSQVAGRQAYYAEVLNFAWVIENYFGFLVFSIWLVMPFVSMRLFAEEKRHQTMLIFQSAPITTWTVVLAKYAASLIVLMILIAMTLYAPLFLATQGEVDWGQVGSAYLGMFLFTAAVLAIGLFASSLTDSQMVAAVVTYAVLFALVLLGVLADFVDIAGAGALRALSVLDHNDDFNKGLINLVDIVYFLSLVFVATFLTKENLESERWR